MSLHTIDSIVGNHLREFRERWGFSYTQIADAARQYGAQWGSSGVRAIERGEASLTLDKLILLGLTTRKLTGEAVTLQQLVATEKDVQLGDKRHPGLTVEASWFMGILAGEEIEPYTRPGAISHNDLTGTFRQDITEFGLPSDPAAGFESLVPTGAEERAAKKLNIPAMAVSWCARALWQQSLDDEARSRAGENATPQARGRVTRILIGELSQHISNQDYKDG